MRAARYNEDFPATKDADGRHLCRWCHQPTPKGRTSFCCDACKDEVLIRCRPSHAAFLVHRRDHGVCAACGIDTERLVELVRRRLGFHRAKGPIAYWMDRGGDANRFMELLDQHGWPLDCSRVWWEADHIVPVAEGGGQCGLKGYRTLCIRCHRAETRALAARLAVRRRAASASNERREVQDDE